MRRDDGEGKGKGEGEGNATRLLDSLLEYALKKLVRTKNSPSDNKEERNCGWG